MKKQKQIWQRQFKTREDYEIARLELMLELTERVISPQQIESEDYLRSQAERIRAEIASLREQKEKNGAVDKRKKRR